MDFLEAALIWLSGFVMGWLVLRTIVKIQVALTLRAIERELKVDINKVISDLEQQAEQGKTTSTVRQLKCEYHQGQLYLWDSDTHEFIAQGPTLESLKSFLRERFGTEEFVLNFEINEEGRRRIAEELKS